MYYVLSLLTGILITVMIAFNGGLTEQYGMYSAAVIVHITGLLLISIITFANKARNAPLFTKICEIRFEETNRKVGSTFLAHKKEHPFAKRHPWFLYLGGAIGVFTTVGINFAFGRISVSAILALGLLGQSMAGLLIDQYGLMGMPRHPFNKQKLIGLLLLVSGIVVMINNFEIIAVSIALIAGVGIIISRTLNAKLADLTSVRTSTFYNYVVGLALTILVFLLLGRGELNQIEWVLSPRFYIYMGGVLGVCVVFISNITVAKVPAFYLTLFIFVGQVFSGILIDMVLLQLFSLEILLGGLLVTAGLCVNLVLDKNIKK